MNILIHENPFQMSLAHSGCIYFSRRFQQQDLKHGGWGNITSILQTTFQTHFRQQKLLYCDSNFPEIGFQKSNSQ